jgi:hypothetical protein
MGVVDRLNALQERLNQIDERLKELEAETALNPVNPDVLEKIYEEEFSLSMELTAIVDDLISIIQDSDADPAIKRNMIEEIEAFRRSAVMYVN